LGRVNWIIAAVKTICSGIYILVQYERTTVGSLIWKRTAIKIIVIYCGEKKKKEDVDGNLMRAWHGCLYS
jgi:hypothetical protein